VEFGRTVHIPIRENGDSLTADWMMPSHARGIVLFAHGSGSGRNSSRNRAVARYLVGRCMGTFLLDLLTPAEEHIDERTRHLRFDIPLLAGRLVKATRWIHSQPEAKGLPLGYFGASTGAGAALVAAAELHDTIAAVVSRGGRPDLAGSALHHVMAPTLLLVGGNDEIVEELNRKALLRLHCPKHLTMIPGATHLFEEHGALEQVAMFAADWFLKYFAEDSLHQSSVQSPRGSERRYAL